ncbi:hypothetical protein [uncultured Sphingomonas sp.]|uniref:hypothetical protein n=1 Tax=uncultured Sphingomonas sp. TaxID=158754 RepID=UPI0025DC796C|nr:hypothetical protein [uncultured Sphingomonas sp.]
MASAAIAGGAVAPARSLSSSARTALVLLVAALILRAPRFGDPNLHVDEIFYLQVGDLMWHGAVPFVDVWDRKPIGLFLLFAAIRLLGGDGIIQYQIVATAFAFGTAVVIAQLARKIGASALAATAAGVVYLASLPALGGFGGQSPVFYNLLVAGAALLTLRALEAPDLRGLTRAGTAAMILCGLAIQLKYTVVFEGCFLGLLLAWRSWRSFGLAVALRTATLFAACGIGPTAAAIAFYAAIGELQAFWFANFLSIGLRVSASSKDIALRLARIGFILVPLMLCAGAALIVRLKADPGAAQTARLRFVIGWLAAAFAGFALFGTYYWHYALPLLVPLAVAVAPLFDRRRVGPVAAVFLVAWNGMLLGAASQSPSASKQQITALTSAVTENLNGGCLFMYDGPPAVDYLSGACHLTPFVFPYHLSLAVEETGLGVDPSMELRRILDARPSVIVSASDSFMEPNRRTLRTLRDTLKRDYRLVGSYSAKGRGYYVHALRQPGSGSER